MPYIFKLFIMETIVVMHNEMEPHNFQLTEKHEVKPDKSLDIYEVF